MDDHLGPICTWNSFQFNQGGLFTCSTYMCARLAFILASGSELGNVYSSNLAYLEKMSGVKQLVL